MKHKSTGNWADSYRIAGDTYQKMCETMSMIALRGPHDESLMLQVANAGEITEVVSVIKSRRVMRAKFSKAGRSSDDDTGNVTAMPARKRRADRKVKRRRRRNTPGDIVDHNLHKDTTAAVNE